jgi:hypothetical protein
MSVTSDYRLPVTIALAGILLFVSATIIANWRKWEATEFPLNLQRGAASSSQFRVDSATEYSIDLDVDRTLPFEELNCLLGLEEAAPSGCGNIVSPLDLEWQITARDASPISGDSRSVVEGGWGPQISRTIGRFAGDPAKTYTLRIESRQDASILDAAHPRVVVRAQPIASKSYLVIGQILTLTGAVTLLIGLGLALQRWRLRSPAQ